MRIGVKESMVEDLGGVVVKQLNADLLEIVAARDQTVGVADGDAVDILHHEHVLGAQIGIHLRRADEAAVGVKARELFEVFRLATEVGLLEKRRPHLLDYLAKVDELVVFHDIRRLTREDAHDIDVKRHGLFDPGALNLDGDIVPAAQLGAVNLREARAAERRRVDRREELLTALVTEFGVERGQHVLERQGIALRLKLGELIAVRARKDLGASRERLPDFHERRAEILEHRAELLGSHRFQKLVLVHDTQDLANARATRLRGQVEPTLGIELPG